MKILGCGPGAAAYRADVSREGNGRSHVRVAGIPAQIRSGVGVGAMSIIALALAACGGGGGSGGGGTTPPPPPAQYTIGGSVTGLTGTGLVLQDNGGDNLSVTQNGSFTFATKVNSGGAYAVTVMTQPTGQTCTVSNGTGTASANVTNVAVACAATAGGNVTIGGTVTGLTGTGLVLQDNGGDNLSITGNGAFTFATPLASGKAYAVTVLTQPSSPTQTCTVANGSGTTASANVTNVAVTCSGGTASVGKFAYTADNGDGTIYGFTINASTGALTPVPNSPYTEGASPAVVALAPNGKWAYSVADSGMHIYAYAIDPNTGQLTAVPGSPFPTGFTATYLDISVDPQSAHVYLASPGDDEVAGLAIDQTSGALTPLAGSPYPAGAGASALPAYTPDNKFLYVMDKMANAVSGYAIDATTGVLTPMPSTFPTGASPSWISFTPDGKFAYVADSGADLISAYSLNDTTGALTPLATPTFQTDENPQDLTIDASGTHLYAPVASGTTPGAVDVFTINADGTLTKVGSVPAGVTPVFLDIDPAAPFAYVASKNGAEVYGYSINTTTGALTALAQSPFSTGAGSEPQFITIDPSGKFGYTANEGTNTISGFSIDLTTGVLTPVPGSPFTVGVKPFFVSISPEAPGIRD
jgi:6-phosphogluconolactonase (cycloisomerase 2 family)